MSRRLRGHTWLFASHIAMAALAAASCGDGTEPGEAPVHYQFALAAFGGDTTAERARSYDCFLYGFFDIPQPVPASGTVRFPVKVERRLFERRGNHDETTRADSSIAEGVVEYTGLGDDSLQFVLSAGPYTVNLGPGELAPFPPPEYAATGLAAPMCRWHKIPRCSPTASIRASRYQVPGDGPNCSRLSSESQHRLTSACSWRALHVEGTLHSAQTEKSPAADARSVRRTRAGHEEILR
jgi:hypothetical protein